MARIYLYRLVYSQQNFPQYHHTWNVSLSQPTSESAPDTNAPLMGTRTEFPTSQVHLIEAKKAARLIQQCVRVFHLRKRHRAAVGFQSIWRRYTARCVYFHQLRLRYAARGVQCLWRAHYVRTRFRIREKVRFANLRNVEGFVLEKRKTDCRRSIAGSTAEHGTKAAHTYMSGVRSFTLWSRSAWYTIFSCRCPCLKVQDVAVLRGRRAKPYMTDQVVNRST